METNKSKSGYNFCHMILFFFLWSCKLPWHKAHPCCTFCSVDAYNLNPKSVKFMLIQDCVNMYIPDSKVHGANMGTIGVLSVPDGPHVGPTNLAIRDNIYIFFQVKVNPECCLILSNNYVNKGVIRLNKCRIIPPPPPNWCLTLAIVC